jgi:hypothetical protein
MAILRHEIWEEPNDDGGPLRCCCLSGPRGDGCRQSLKPGARLLTTFEAGSHFEAMTTYNHLLSREAYTTDQPWDYIPYPEEWFADQERTPKG